MVTSGPNGSWRKPASPTKPWIMDSVVAAMLPRCRRSVIGSAQVRCKAFSVVGGDVCPRRLPRPMYGLDTDIKCRLVNSRLLTPAYSTGHPLGGCGLKV